MTLETLIELKNQSPFRPFTLRVAEGREITVPTNDHIFIVPNQRDVIIYDGHGRMHWLDLPLITGASASSQETPS